MKYQVMEKDSNLKMVHVEEGSTVVSEDGWTPLKEPCETREEAIDVMFDFVTSSSPEGKLSRAIVLVIAVAAIIIGLVYLLPKGL